MLTCVVCFVVTGDGFSATKSRLSVTFEDDKNNLVLDFPIVSSTFNTIVCTVPSIPASRLNGTANEFSGNITVEHNFIEAACKDTACASFQYAASGTPTIESVSLQTVNAGSVLSITGNLLTANTVIKLDAYICPVTNFLNSSALECTVPEMEGGVYFVKAYEPSLGNAMVLPGPISVKQVLRLDSFSPNVSSMAGGLTVTLYGEGFTSDLTKLAVTVNGNNSVILSANYTWRCCEFGQLD
jgi:hypothetical protein